MVRIQNQSGAKSAKINRVNKSNSCDSQRKIACQWILKYVQRYLVEKIYNDINNSTWVLNELSKSEYIVKPIHYNILVKINPWP